MLSVEKLSITTAGSKPPRRVLLRETSLGFTPGKLHAIVGPNGSGKTTLLRAMAGLIKPTTGETAIDKESIASWSHLKIASQISFVEAEHHSPFAFTVADTVLWGRWHKHQGHPSAFDQEIASDAIAKLSLLPYLQRSIQALSLGERKKTHLAKSLAAATPYILWDEPLAPLDIRASIDVLKLARQLTQNNICVIASIHDIALALNFADTLTILDQGHVKWHGPCASPDSLQNLENVFSIKISSETNSQESKFYIVP